MKAVAGFMIFGAITIFISLYAGWRFGFEAGYDKAQLKNLEQKLSADSTPVVIDPALSRKSINAVRVSRKITKPVRTQSVRLPALKTKTSPSEGSSNPHSLPRDSSQLVEEKSAKCRWTVGRLQELKRVVESGGRGSESQFCSEFKKRVNELYEFECANRGYKEREAFGGVCG